MAAKTGTYTLISSQTLGSSASSVTFSSLPQTYTDLVLVISAAASAQKDIDLRFNSDTAGNYSNTWIAGNGTSTHTGRTTSTSSLYITYYGGVVTTLGNSLHMVYLQDYANSTTYKTVLSRASSAGAGVDAVVGQWRNTAAITNIQIGPNMQQGVNTWSSGSSFKLYGIEAAK
jgi:predicted ribonuclease toxin of YeeF-YezG toxin-antitoxin module